MTELRLGRRPVVLHEGHAISGGIPARQGETCVVIIGRRFRRIHHEQLLRGDENAGYFKTNVKEPVSALDTASAEADICQILESLGPALHPTKKDFSGAARLNIIGVRVNKEHAEFYLPHGRLGKVQLWAKLFKRYV